jgi:WD40 repeat protein
MWSAMYSPDGKQIVTTDDACAQVWDARTNQLLFILPHGAEVYQAVYSADGSKIVTVAADVVRIWDAASGALVRELRQARSDGKPTDYYLVTVSADGRLVAAIDSHGMAAHVWDASTGAPLAELRSNADRSPSLTFSADSRWLAMSGGGDVRVFDTRTWRLAITLATTHVRSLSFDPTGPRLATGGTSGDASIWEVPSGARLHHLREVGEPVSSVVFSPDGKLVAVGGEVWNATSGALQSRLTSFHGKIQSVEFDPTSMFVVIAGDNGSVVVVDAVQGMQVTALEGPHSVVRSAHFDQSSRRVIGASWDGTARVWDASSPYRRWSSLPISDSCGLIMNLVPDRQFIAVGCRDHTTRVWDTASDRLIAELPPLTQVEGDFAPTYPAVSADGDRAAISRGKVVEVHELPGGRLLRTIEHGAPVSAVAFATAGHDLVSGGVDGSLLITRDGHEPFVLPASPSGIDAAMILVDGRVLAAAGKQIRIYAPDQSIALATLEAPTRIGLLRPSGDGRRLLTVPIYTGNTAPAVLWDLEHYRLIARLEGSDGQVFAARFVASDSAIITTGNDGVVRLWNGATGQVRQAYRASSRFLADATLSPDGSLVVGGASDGLVWFWDVATGRPLWTLPAHRSAVVGLHFEGTDIVTRGFGGDVSRWMLPNAERVIEACNARAACGIVPR